MKQSKAQVTTLKNQQMDLDSSISEESESHSLKKKMKSEKQSEASRRGRRSRQKGNEFERKIAREMREVYHASPVILQERIRRGNQKRFGHDDPDVKTPHFWVECKHGKEPKIRAAMEQAMDAMKKKGIDMYPIAVTRKDHNPIYCTMLFSHWKYIMSQLNLEIPSNWDGPAINIGAEEEEKAYNPKRTIKDESIYGVCKICFQEYLIPTGSRELDTQRCDDCKDVNR
jgi:hypothetical protein